MRQRHLLWGFLFKLQPFLIFVGVFQRSVILKKNSSTTFSGNFTKPLPRSSIESSFRFSVCAHAPSMEPTANHKHVKMCKQNMLLAKAGESEFTPLSKVEKMAGESENGGDGPPPLGSWRFRTWKPSFSRFHSLNLGVCATIFKGLFLTVKMQQETICRFATTWKNNANYILLNKDFN